MEVSEKGIYFALSTKKLKTLSTMTQKTKCCHVVGWAKRILKNAGKKSSGASSLDCLAAGQILVGYSWIKNK